MVSAPASREEDASGMIVSGGICGPGRLFTGVAP
jgi:hypothetical protein